MAQPNTNEPDIFSAKAAGTINANGRYPAVNGANPAGVIMDDPFNLVIGAPAGATVALVTSFDGGTTWTAVARDTAGTPMTFTSAIALVVPAVECGQRFALDVTGYVSAFAYRMSN